MRTTVVLIRTENNHITVAADSKMSFPGPPEGLHYDLQDSQTQDNSSTGRRKELMTSRL